MKKITDISEVKVIREFEDDHLPCAEISFKDQDGEQHQLEVFCISPGAVSYWHESVTAKKDLIHDINTQDPNYEEDAE